MVLTENGRKRPGSDNLGFSSLGNGEQKKGSLNTSVGSSVLSSHPEDGAIVLGEKALRGNRSVSHHRRRRCHQYRFTRVTTRTGKPGKWEGIFKSGKSQGVLNRLENSGKITQNTGKVREFYTNIIYYF